MTWVTRWKYVMAEKPIRPGIWRLKDGGFYVRARVMDTSRRREVSAVLRNVKAPAEAQKYLDELVAVARAEARGEIRTPQLWSDFAVSWMSERVRRGKIASAATMDRWNEALKIMIPVFGRLDTVEFKRAHIDAWLNGQIAEWMTKGRTVMRKRRRKNKIVDVPVTTVIKPSTVNGWLRILRAISHGIKTKFDLPKSAFDGIEFFDEGRIYTREQPNALPPELLPKFMQLAREKYPQHYAMILLGFVTGLRPSSMRPLRRKGPEPDIDWETGLLFVRRSHSRRQKVMDRTKTKKDNVIALPPAVMDSLREHVARLEGKQAESDLLFPSEMGELRTRNVLARPFAAIAEELGLTITLTPRGMRRTFNDVARAAGMNDVVTMSVSGHVTDKMRIHYSTAQTHEQRVGLSKVHALVSGSRPARKRTRRPKKRGRPGKKTR